MLDDEALGDGVTGTGLFINRHRSPAGRDASASGSPTHRGDVEAEVVVVALDTNRLRDSEALLEERAKEFLRVDNVVWHFVDHVEDERELLTRVCRALVNENVDLSVFDMDADRRGLKLTLRLNGESTQHVLDLLQERSSLVGSLFLYPTVEFEELR